MAREQVRQGSWFVPKGDVAEWQILYGRLSLMKPNELLSYDQLDELLGRDFKTNRAPIYRATQELQRLNRRTVIAVSGKGYRIASAAEHAVIAQKHYRSSRRQVRMAVEKASSADRAELSAEERARMDSLETTLRIYATALKRLDSKAQGKEDLIESLQAQQRKTDQNVQRTTDSVDRITRLLRKHGIDQTDKK